MDERRLELRVGLVLLLCAGAVGALLWLMGSFGSLSSEGTLRVRFAHTGHVVEGAPVKLTVSIGYATFPEHGKTGRALLQSDDVIPQQILAYDGKSVTVSGYVLPLRVQRGLTKEFLLLRDQGTCCFGQRAQINHFIRVKLGADVKAETGIPYQVSGKLRVGEIMIQGYLTGIYRLDADEVKEAVGW